jgi:23S rRNA pseudouridine2605 synthase
VRSTSWLELYRKWKAPGVTHEPPGSLPFCTPEMRRADTPATLPAVSQAGDQASARSGQGRLRVAAFHKPRGVLVSRVSEAGSPTVFELLPEPLRDWFSVGRLDKDSEGLLLFSSNPAFAQRLMDPGSVTKRYLVTVEGLPAEDGLERLRGGGLLLDGRLTRPVEVRRLGKAPRGGTRLEVALHEGINRQIRRLFRALGHRVRRIVRVAVGPVELGDLAPGTWRELCRGEVEALLSALRSPAASADAS